ncbi:MAG: endonuclease/exonuclease/phosphatase family protein [Acidobacteriota bacterium]|nr:endonuclease/exonuclease/phosphatase family protein [Acidobacteriota bacterium]
MSFNLPMWRFDAALDEWVPNRESSAEQRATLSPATFNAWFGNYYLEERAAALLDLLLELKPDIVGLQEVTDPLLEIIRNDPRIRKQYYLSDKHGLSYDRYGTLLMSRSPFQVLTQYELPSLMDRRLLVGELTINGEVLAVATVHLESTRPTGSFRQQQLGHIFSILDRYDHAILMGDFNFDPADPEQASLNDRYVDIWPFLYPDDPGFTENTDINSMRFRLKGKPKHVRYDRILIRSGRNRWRPRDMKILGTEPLMTGPEEVFISDHFGLFATLDYHGAD